MPAPPTTVVNWTRLCPPFDQGALGSCTANATVGALMTVPFHRPGWNFTEVDAAQLYERATQFNPPGEQYPPNDQGSSGPCIADALETAGVVKKSVHATDLATMLGLLTLGPIIVGLHWYSSFDTPLADGECAVAPGATVRGGHEVEAFGVDPVTKMVWFYQSWGASWGALGNGTFSMTYDTIERQFTEGGDATSFTLASRVPTLKF
ncbi:MAG TPA: hypothetical protein VIJ99_00615 [Acidimicrobiales bacterium]